MPAQLNPINARLRHRFPQAARSIERVGLGLLVMGLVWLAMINVWVEVSLAQEGDPVPNQGKPGQVQVCEYDAELDGLLCGEWVDIDTLPETDVPELNCPYGVYWDGSRFRCKPRCYYIVLVGWFCHAEPPTPTPTPTPPTFTACDGTKHATQAAADAVKCPPTKEYTDCKGNKHSSQAAADAVKCPPTKEYTACDGTKHKTQAAANAVKCDSTLSITAGDAITEGANATFTITATPKPKSSLTVSLTVGQQGDYAKEEALGAKTVTIPTTGSAGYSVATVDDSRDEPDGSITLTLGAGTGYTLPDPPSATVSVADNDDPPPLTGLRLIPIKDGLELTYDRITGAKRRFRFDLYHSTSDPGDVSTKNIALNDSSYHARRFLREEISDKATFKNLPAGWYYAVGRICDSDNASAACGSTHAISGVTLPRKAFLIPPTATLLAEPSERTDERDVSFKLIYPGGAPAGGAKVKLLLDGQASWKTDYNFPGPQVVLIAGETEKTLSLRVRHDQVLEADELISIALDGVEDDPDTGYSNTAHELTISDLADPLLLRDDVPGQLDFEVSGPGPHRLRLRLQTAYDPLVALSGYEFDRRSFTLQAESRKASDPKSAASIPIASLWTVNASHDSDTALYAPGDSRVVDAAGNLPGYARLGSSHLYWREGDDPHDHRYLEVVLDPGPDDHDRYRLTLVKPDFAITARPILKRSGDGRYSVALTLYNAESYDSGRRDFGARIQTYCHDGKAASLAGVSHAMSSFADLRGDGDTHLLDGRQRKTLSIPVLCPRGAYLGRDTIVAVTQVIDHYGHSTELPGPRAHGISGFRGPDREDTLWAAQKNDVAGGLSIATPEACTISFVLSLQRLGYPAVPAASTTAHCADDDKLSVPWQQGSPLLAGIADARSPNQFLGTTELHPLKSPADPLEPSRAKCRINATDGKPEPKANCRRGDQSYATIKRSADLDDYRLPAGKKNPYLQFTTSEIARPKTQNQTGEKRLEIGLFETGNRPFEIVGARPPNPDPDPFTGLRETLHKVGVTTGWTEGTLASGTDLTCPGGKLGTSDNEHAGIYHECRSEASYASSGGDSGAPVFVRKEGSATEVLLVGVHWGRSTQGGVQKAAKFIPIDRIYAEALINGYDWSPDWLRPLPRLENALEESLTINRSTGAATAVFENTDFSRSQALVYEVVLFQQSNGTWDSDPLAIDQITHKDPVAEFTGLKIPDDAKGSDYRVQVRMNAKLVTGNKSLDALDHRGGWGPASTLPAAMISYPEKLALSAPASLHEGQTGKLMVAAAQLAPESGYRLELSSDNQNAAFDSACSVFEMATDVPEKVSSYEKELEVHGCKPGELEIDADLERDDLLVAAGTGAGTVLELPELDLDGLSEEIPRGAVRDLELDVTGLDPTGTYRLVATLSEGTGLNAGCTVRTVATDLPAGAKSYKSKFTLHACSPGDSELDIVLSLDGTPLLAEKHTFKVLDQVLTLGELPKSIKVGEEIAISANAKNLDPKTAYRLHFKTDGKVAGFGGGCATSSALGLPANSESFGGVARLKACATGQTDLTVELVSAGSALKSATGKVTVVAATTAKPPGTVFLAGLGGAMRLGGSTGFTVKTDKLSSEHDYTIKVELAGARVGFDKTCKDRTHEITVPAGSESYQSSRITFHACGKGLADVTVKLLSSNTTVATDFSDVAVI